MNFLELALEPEIYCPSIDLNGNYIDKIPTSQVLKNGVRCPCGTRQDKSYNTNPKFSAHIKSKKHQQWLSELNINRLNYYEENIKIKDTLQNQRLLIANLEKSINSKNITIDYLTQQLSLKFPPKHIAPVGNLIDFEN
jgi:hypothetical protein